MPVLVILGSYVAPNDETVTVVLSKERSDILNLVISYLV